MRIWKFVWAVVLIVWTTGAAQAADVSLQIHCIFSLPDRAIIYFSYTASEAVPGTSWVGPNENIAAMETPPIGLLPGEHRKEFFMEVYGTAFWQFQAESGESWALTFDVNTQAPDCDHAGDSWQPSAPSISIPAPGTGPYTLEIMDAYGHWSLVTDAAHPDGIVLYNKGGNVELIGSVGQDIDPSHYRLIPHS